MTILKWVILNASIGATPKQVILSLFFTSNL